MPVVSNISINANGGYYDRGQPFTEAKWATVFLVYEKEIQSHGRCSTPHLAKLTGICQRSASKEIDYYDSEYCLHKNCVGMVDVGLAHF